MKRIIGKSLVTGAAVMAVGYTQGDYHIGEIRTDRGLQAPEGFDYTFDSVSPLGRLVCPNGPLCPPSLEALTPASAEFASVQEPGERIRNVASFAVLRAPDDSVVS